MWASIAGLSCLNWYVNVDEKKIFSQFDLASLLLGHISAELLETYSDPIRNHPIVTPAAVWALTKYILAPMDFNFVYKHWKFITGLALVGEYTAYSSFAFKTMKLIEWFKQSREEGDDQELAMRKLQEGIAALKTEMMNVKAQAGQNIDSNAAGVKSQATQNASFDPEAQQTSSPNSVRNRFSKNKRSNSVGNSREIPPLASSSRPSIHSSIASSSSSFSLNVLNPQDPTELEMQHAPPTSPSPERQNTIVIPASVEDDSDSDDTSDQGLLGGNATSSS